MLAAINKSLANTTISVAGYYVPDSIVDWHHMWNGQATQDNWSIWAQAESNFDGVKVGVQGVYVDGDYKQVAAKKGIDSTWVANSDNATYAFAAKAGMNFGDLDVTLIGAYVNDGGYSIQTAGAYKGTIEDTSAFWGNSLAGFFGGNTLVGDEQMIVRGLATYKFAYGKLLGELAYDNAGDHSKFDSAWGGRVKYTLPSLAGVTPSVEYRYAKYSDFMQRGKDEPRQRIRVEAYYKF
jgi:hypothetical protein